MPSSESDERLIRMTLEEKLKLLPGKPGVYLMKDRDGEIIYVGKAVSLKNRVRSYFQSSRYHGAKVEALVEKIADFECITTDSEVEALILESNLIKKHSPWYNVRLKDDKSYPYLKVTVNELFPRVFVVRRIQEDGSRYFGPYTNVGAMRETFAFLKKFFPIRSCRKNIGPDGQERPCLNFHIKRCAAPCAGLIKPEEYRQMIDQVCLFLEGRQELLLPEMRRKMQEAADGLAFEKAAEIRDRIAAMEKVIEKQKIVSFEGEDQDVLAFTVSAPLNAACAQVFFVRSGKLVGREQFMLEGVADDSPESIMTAFVQQYYSEAAYVPKEVLLRHGIEDSALVENWLAEKKGQRVYVRVPRRGEKKELVEMVVRNAALALAEEETKAATEKARTEGAVLELQQYLDLPNLPDRIEAYDISNIQGAEAVGSMVVFAGGKAAPSEYRRFKIKTVEGPNDFAMMQEVIRRRFLRGLREREELAAQAAEEVQKVQEAGKAQEEENAQEANRVSDRVASGPVAAGTTKFAVFPDLVLIDGGKGQLNAAREVMHELGVAEVPTVGLAKEFEHIFKENQSDPVILPRDSMALYLVQRVRDEAHRFAVTYHRELRGKRDVSSKLDEVAGIGPKRKKALLKHFGSIKRVGEASAEELAAVPGMSREVAEAVWQHLRK
ncbi:MAG: excinuclease ABC subunit UvrC [Firmicutes bacterium]|nr:excinuclease ABC subunit UvrC [Bacillota bacterium]